jgi:hypothetical protein
MIRATVTMRPAAVMLLIAAIALPVSCKKVEDSMLGISPRYVARQFFKTWKKKDWKELYRMTHPAFMQKLRLQKLSPEDSALDDETLFIKEFARVQKAHPGKTIQSYSIVSISSYKAGDTTVWVGAVVNGKKKSIPLALDGLVLKVDLTRIE